MMKTAKGTVDYKSKKLNKLDYVTDVIEQIFKQFHFYD